MSTLERPERGQDKADAVAHRSEAPRETAVDAAGWAGVLRLQRLAGNSAVSAVLARMPNRGAAGPPPALDRSVIDREISEVTSNPNVAATRSASGRNVLVPEQPAPVPPPLPAKGDHAAEEWRPSPAGDGGERPTGRHPEVDAALAPKQANDRPVGASPDRRRPGPQRPFHRRPRHLAALNNFRRKNGRSRAGAADPPSEGSGRGRARRQGA
jgi:hypothetical protein